MTDLQKKVYFAIKSHSTPEEQADAAIRAVSAWYWEQGYFHKPSLVYNTLIHTKD